jgi:SNF2 family DNA or RNA helicase
MLSGTAIKNKREEIFTQIQLVNEDMFATKADVKRMSIGGLWNYIQPYYFQRSKFDVAKDLPEKITQIMELPAEGEVYDIDPANPPSFEEISEIKARIAKDKASTTVAFVREVIEQSNAGILVFTDSLEAAKEIQSSLGEELAVLHHGQMDDKARERVKLDWQAGILKQPVFVTTRQSLAVGANMTRAEYVVFSDLPWTAADVAQAENRAHRIGSRNKVNVYWISIANNFWDKKLSQIIMLKYELTKKVNEGKQITPEEREWMDKPASWSDLFSSRKKS